VTRFGSLRAADERSGAAPLVTGATLSEVPTVRPRHTLTETDELRRALDMAARRWPQDRDRRSRLLARLVEDWVQHEQQTAASERHDLRAVAGSLTGVYADRSLEDLRDEWPV